MAHRKCRVMCEQPEHVEPLSSVGHTFDCATFHQFSNIVVSELPEPTTAHTCTDRSHRFRWGFSRRGEVRTQYQLAVLKALRFKIFEVL